MLLQQIRRLFYSDELKNSAVTWRTTPRLPQRKNQTTGGQNSPARSTVSSSKVVRPPKQSVLAEGGQHACLANVGLLAWIRQFADVGVAPRREDHRKPSPSPVDRHLRAELVPGR